MNVASQPSLTLYYSRRSCSLACHIVLRETGLKFELVEVKIRNDEQKKPEYLKINPLGKIPALVIDSEVLTETHAILTFLGDFKKTPNLIPPSGTTGRVRAHEWMNFLSSTVHVTFRTIFRPYNLIGKDIPLDKAALVGCAVMTGVGAVINTAKPAAGESIAIFGSGGVGISCIQGAVLSGAYPIIAVDVKENKLELAKQFGATHTVDASKLNAVEEIQRITGGGANYTFEAVGRPQLMRDSWDALAKCGTAVVIGGAKVGDEVSIPALDFPFTEKAIRGTGYGSARMNVDIPKLLDLYRGGKLNLDDMVTSTYPLDAVNEAFADLHAGKNLRGVLMM